ncbi:MAG: hypothetical protein IKX95_00590, partial [Lachnospiraceae bacterium]|nr:hypothetical protein [Lachnospiraceae bacterium]
MSTNKWFRRLKYRFAVMAAIILMFPSTAVAQRIGAGIVTAHAKSVSDIVFDYSEMCFKPGEERAVSATPRNGRAVYTFGLNDIGGPDPQNPEDSNTWRYCVYNWKEEDNRFVIETWDTAFPGARAVVSSSVWKDDVRAWVDGGAVCNITIVDPASTVYTVTFDADGGFDATKKEVVSGGTVSA